MKDTKSNEERKKSSKNEIRWISPKIKKITIDTKFVGRICYVGQGGIG